MKSFDDLWDELSDRNYTDGPDQSSTTGKLLASGVHGIGKKIVEEAAEVWMAAEYESDENLANEISQLLYHLQVLMLARGIEIEDVYEKL
ncbi:MAG: phosphoribosyl-ATP diphosphatase [Actinobacteria bacterium]|nr:phosphoribosyl-ATP diphosphatase [Actinomycetota bacterium]